MSRLLFCSLLIGCLLLSSCGSGPTTPSPKRDTAPTVESTSDRESVPELNSCHQITFRQASTATAPSASVSCSQPHTSVTIAVGALPQLRDGHLLAVDSPTIQAQLDKTCSAELPGFLGGTQENLQLSQFRAIWFTPSLKEADLGANWYRCDVVAVKRDGQLLRLPARAKGILARPGSTGFSTCGTGTPGQSDFAKVACRLPHQWRATRVFLIPDQAKYLDAGITTTADQFCKDAAATAAGDRLKFSWVFTWPSPEQWQGGSRSGICWLPEV